jgi:hypothetical protein
MYTMNKESRELSRSGLQVFSREISPEYSDLRGRLLGNLAAHGASLEQLAQKDINDRLNVDLLVDFTISLPAYYRDGFKADDPFKARMLVANTIWYGFTPFYVVGNSLTKGNEALLVACAKYGTENGGAWINYQHGSLHIVKSSKFISNKIKEMNQVNCSDFPSPGEMKRMFDAREHKLIVSRDTPKTVELPLSGITSEKLTHLTDLQMAAFDVNSYMHRLATAFGVEPELDELLAQH